MAQRPDTWKALDNLAREAGKLAQEVGRADQEIKDDGTLVTQADQACEALIVAGLGRLFPEDGLIGEEGAATQGRSGRRWYIDPIDGTQAFVERLAYWGPTFCCLDDQGPLLGVTHFPMLGETWFYQRGQGAYCGDRRLQPLRERPIDRRSTVLVPSRWWRWFEMDWPGRARNLGGLAAHLAMAAQGGPRAVFVPAGWKIWDVATGLGLLAEVGARATPLVGEAFASPLDAVHSGGKPFVVGSPEAVERLKAGLVFRGA